MNNLLAVQGVRKTITVLGTVTGKGELLPPYILYAHKRTPHWMKKAGALPDGNNLFDIILCTSAYKYFYVSIGIQYAFSESGWMVNDDFFLIFKRTNFTIQDKTWDSWPTTPAD